MAPEPHVKPLSHTNRIWVFRALLAIFCVAMPIFVFYAMGYRIDFANDRSIITVGGMYVSAEAENIQMYVDEEPVVNMRLFRQAAYIQNLEAGMHRIHVQGDGLQTWVKELPVYSHIVTEAAAFNLPTVPQIRLITEWLTENNVPILPGTATTTALFPNASTTNAVFATTSSATRTLTPNTEYEYVTSLFAASSTTSGSVSGAVNTLQQNFSFDTLRFTGTNASTTSATTTKALRDMRLIAQNDEVYAVWTGVQRDIPYYFCVTYTSSTTTTAEYGEHVYDAITEQFADTYNFATDEPMPGTRLCRSEIRIDRMGQEVAWFDFMPNDMHHVLMLLADGLYLVEVDDRAWQNVQLLYPGTDLEARVDGGRIYVFDGEYYLEILTELPA